MSEPLNPYAPPTSNLEADGIAIPFELVMVGSGTRFLNFIIDNSICVVIQIFFGITIVILFGEKGGEHLKGCMSNLYGLLLSTAYYIVMESLFSQTLGKMATKTVVVNKFGYKPSLGQIIGRSFARWIPFEPFSCFGTESCGWHDSAANTFVVKRTPPSH